MKMTVYRCSATKHKPWNEHQSCHVFLQAVFLPFRPVEHNLKTPSVPNRPRTCRSNPRRSHGFFRRILDGLRVSPACPNRQQWQLTLRFCNMIWRKICGSHSIVLTGRCIEEVQDPKPTPPVSRRFWRL